MSGTMTVNQWVRSVDEHYLSEYVRGGGSAVKFAVCYPGIDRVGGIEALVSAARSQGYLTARADAAVTKVHLIEQFLAAVSDQMPWQKLTDQVLSDFARANHWDVPEELTDEAFVAQIDRLNGLGEQQISLELQRRIGNDVLADRSLAKDFRVAMTWMLRARLTGGDESKVITNQVTEWLGGRVRAISEMRRYQIYTKVNRANARHLLGSLLEWVRRAGFPGLVVAIDGNRLLQSQRQVDGSVNYTKAALLDAYEVFRQFIDSTDEFDGLLLAVFVPETFLDLEPRGRGLGRYSALLYRVYDEVRDRNLANPLTALTRLSESQEVVA